MKLLRPLFTSYIIFFSLSSTYHLGEVSGHSSRTNPSNFNSFWDGKLMGLFKQITQDLTWHKLDDNEENYSSKPAGPGGPTYKTVSVDDFGAKGGGNDDTQKEIKNIMILLGHFGYHLCQTYPCGQKKYIWPGTVSAAFEKAWEQGCSSADGVALLVPKEKSYHLKPIRFTGPCKSNVRVEIYGTLEASVDQSDYNQDSKHWLVFDSVKNLVVEGGGTINGNGKIWWENSCKRNKHKPCKEAPTALTFHENQHLVVKNLKIQDAQQMHVSFESCADVEASNLVITAPGDSPNTDGIHVAHTQNILIASTTIGTGDDCISIASGSNKVKVQDIICGPGHGISIGSLGETESRDCVSGVILNGAKISGTSNGVRIKTWQGGSGFAKDIRFENVEMNNVSNPIIIDQNYCDQHGPCKEQSSAVQVQHVVYRNIQGSSASDVAIDFDCSRSHPCRGIKLQNVNLKGEGYKAVRATCSNVETKIIGNVSPGCS